MIDWNIILSLFPLKVHTPSKVLRLKNTILTAVCYSTSSNGAKHCSKHKNAKTVLAAAGHISVKCEKGSQPCLNVLSRKQCQCDTIPYIHFLSQSVMYCRCAFPWLILVFRHRPMYRHTWVLFCCIVYLCV